MKEITPHGYQSASALAILNRLTILDALADIPVDMTPTIAHSAPTGAGKTITMIHLVDQLITGVDGTPRPDLRVLWVSDSPQLNAQTRAKFQRFSDEVDTSTYLIEDDIFDEEYLRPGAIGFINTQKLSRPGLLLQTGDGRDYTFWDTMNNTLRDYFKNTLVIIDEAHLGWGLNRANHRTILSRFLDNQDNDATLDRPPKIVGISATPQRFQSHCETIQQTPHLIETNIELVRNAGGLKDDQVTYFDQPFDALLEQAVGQFSIMSDDWKEYNDQNQDTPLVTPLLCIQVQDGQGENLSETPLGEIVETLQESDLDFELNGSIFHCFSGNQEIDIGGLNVPYIEPSTISGRSDARIILFKTAIATGWDCPRAEVLISDRRSNDFTVVCQLIGRMVRAPLHKRIEPPNDNLNEIHLYLPRFNEDNVNTAIGYLQGELGVDLNQTTNPATYPRLTGQIAETAFEALSGLPTYRIHRLGVIRPSQFRLLSLCTLLEADGLGDGILDGEIHIMADIINTRVEEWLVEGGDPYVEGEPFTYTPVTFDVLQGVRRPEGEAIEMRPTESSFTKLFEENCKTLPQSVVRRFNDITESSFNVATVNLMHIIEEEGFVAAVEQHCQTRINELRTQYSDSIQALSSTQRARYRPIILESGIPEQIELELPEELTVSASSNARADHLYVNDQYQFHCDLTGLEDECLQRFQSEEGFIGWYRNPIREVSGLRIPYRVEDNQNPYDCGTQYGKFPDFLVVRRVDNDCVIDIYEPHAPTDETRPWFRIAQGFSYFAELHGDCFGRIMMSARYENETRYFDFQNEQEREIAYSSDSFLEFWNAPRDN